MEESQKQQKDTSPPRVEIFGEEIKSWKNSNKHRFRGGDCCGHRHHHGWGAIWGLIFLFVGVLLLLNNAGLVSWQFWHIISWLWPAFLILVGIRIILGHNWISGFIVFVIALILFSCVVLYGLIRTDSPLTKHLSPRAAYFMDNLNRFK